MLYYLFQYLEEHYNFPGASLFIFLSFRAGGAILISLIISMIFGRRVIRFLQKKQMGEVVRDLGLEGQMQKQGTPTMGGIIIVLATVIPCLLFADLSNVYVLVLLLSMLWMAIIGFADDYIKVFRKNKAGLQGKFKVVGQVVLGLIISLTILQNKQITVRVKKDFALERKYEIQTVLPPTEQGDEYVYANAYVTNVPFVKGNQLDYGFLFGYSKNGEVWLTWILYSLLVIFTVTAVSNGANLTDGLDGLAAGVSTAVVFSLAVFAYLSGNMIFSDYLDIFFIPRSSEIVIFAACLMGGTIGFLWYNAFPASVFMGDTGSLSLGGVIAAMAVLLRKELLLPIICGVFLIENLSVILQVAYFKYTKRRTGTGKRIFLMSPLHHHYQKKGIPEAKIVVRFWIVSVMLATLAIITLKIR